MAGLYFVIIYTGSRHPEHVRSYGAFESVADANVWCEREGFEQTPGEGEWATVIPRPEVAAEGPGWSGLTPSIPPSPASRPLARLREIATCPICQAGELTRMDGPPEWYVLPAATLGLPDDADKRVGRGLPVGVSVCSHCEHVALFLPPTLDRPEGRRDPGNKRSRP